LAVEKHYAFGLSICVRCPSNDKHCKKTSRRGLFFYLTKEEITKISNIHIHNITTIQVNIVGCKDRINAKNAVVQYAKRKKKANIKIKLKE
jgi:queuine/archaeosine tRNA-ribosyltransferase